MSLTTFEIYITSFLEAMIDWHLHSSVYFNFFLLHHAAYRILVLDQGLNH